MSLYSDLNEVLTPYAQRIKGLAAADEQIKADLGAIIGGAEQREIQFVYGTFINDGNAAEIGETVDLTNLTEWYSLKHAIVECQEGDEFLIDVAGTTNARAWAFLTSNNILISRANANEAVAGKITAPQNAGKVLIQAVYRQTPEDTVTDEGAAYKLIQGTGNVVRFDIAQGKTEAEKARARDNIGINNAFVRYDSVQSLTDAQKNLAQRNIGIITTKTVDLITTVPSYNQTIFTVSNVSVGSKLLYHIKITHSELGYIALYDNQDTILRIYGKYDYSQTAVDYDGEFTVPENFSYAKWILSTNSNAQEFTLSQIIEESDIDNGGISRYYGKKVSIIGDSISTFNAPGYKIDGYEMFYPNHGVTNVNQTWWKMVIDSSGSDLEVNASYSGSRVTNTGSGPDFYQRTSPSIIGNPDLIFVALGVNDVGNNIPLGEYDFDTEYTNLSEATFRTAYIKGMKSLKAQFTNAVIVAIIFSNFTASYRDSVIEICTTLGVESIITLDYDQADYLHPNLVGMNQIARQVLYPTDTSLTQRYIAADAKTVGERFASIDSLSTSVVRYNTEQSLTDIQKLTVQKNIGLTETVIDKENLVTTVPTKNQILFNSESVNVGDKITYHIKMTVDDMAYITLCNSQNTVIAAYGKFTYGQTGNFDGEFFIPTGFSYAKWTTNDPNAQEFTLSKVIGESDVPLYGNAVRYDIEQDLTESQKATARANIGASSGGGEVDFEEPFFTDVPMLYVTGTLPTAKSQGELPVMITYKSRTTEFTSYATLKVQGDSTSALPKKNFTIKLFKDSAHTVKDKRQFKTWSKYNKFVIKANYHEITHSRNVVGARIWSDMVKSRSDYTDLPTEMLESDNLACIDGFPVMMYVNGQYYGRYAFNITKDNMLNMDDSNPDHAMVQGQGYDAGTRFEEPITTNWSDELTDDLAHVETRWKEILSFVGTSSDADFKNNLGNYFSVPSLIDFYLFGAALFSYDSYGKNQSYLTYDGNYFICSAYDMDLIIGLHVSGHFALGATEPWLPYYGIEWTDNNGGHNPTFTYIANRLFYKLSRLFDVEIKARWAELRAHGGALSFENIDKRFVEWCSLVTTEQMAEDYASTTAGGAFTGMANVDGGNASTNNIRQIVKFVYDRLTYLDTLFVQNT